MKNWNVLTDKLAAAAPSLELRRNEPMDRHTTFRVGGPAALMALPKTEEELLAAGGGCRSLGEKPVLVGNGSNLLVDDAGLDAFVVKTVPRAQLVADGGDADLCRQRPAAVLAGQRGRPPQPYRP